MMGLESFFSQVRPGDFSPEFDRWIKQTKQHARRLIEAIGLLERLRDSWRDQYDPGKGQPYVFLVREYEVHADERNCGQHLWIDWCDAFHARELIDDVAEAELGATHWRENGKRYAVPLGHVHETRRDQCVECNHGAYVLGLHWQSCDSPYGDTWILQLIRVCPLCAKVHRFAQRTENYRMTNLLRSPKQ